ncbi:MAG: hypothetical protein WCT00_06280, partial [Bacilli bacterium]
MEASVYEHPLMRTYWEQLGSGFPRARELFEDCMLEALAALSREGLSAYLDAAGAIGRLGRGDEPMLAFMAQWPQVAKTLGEAALEPVMAAVMVMQKSPNGRAIAPFLQSLAPVARRLRSVDRLRSYIDIALDLMARTSGSIHGHQTTLPSPGLVEFFDQAPYLFRQLSLDGLRSWTDYGIRNYANHPERQQDYFALESADSLAVLQRERHGVLFADVERRLDLYLRGLWGQSAVLVPYTTIYD